MQITIVIQFFGLPELSVGLHRLIFIMKRKLGHQFFISNGIEMKCDDDAAVHHAVSVCSVFLLKQIMAT